MIKPHITPGFNGYTSTAGKQIKAINSKARAAAEKERKEREAERFARSYLEEHPETTQLTGYEIVNQHLHER